METMEIMETMERSWRSCEIMRDHGDHGDHGEIMQWSWRRGVKKPPLAPKPKLPASTKPSPPPIAPKPGLLPQPAAVLNPSPSPATLKRAKPALAPKPCVLAPQTKPGAAHTQSQEHPVDGSLDLLNAKNGILSSPRDSLSEADYIIAACCSPGGPEADPPCQQRLHNGNDRSDSRDDDDDDVVDVGLPNGNAAEGHVAAVTTGEGDREDGQRPREQEEGKGEAEEGCRLTDSFQPKPRDKPQRHKHLAKGRTSRGGQGSPEAPPPQQLQEKEKELEPGRCLETALGQLAKDDSASPGEAPREGNGHKDTEVTGAVATAQSLSPPSPPPPSPPASPHPSPSPSPTEPHDEPDGSRHTHINGLASPPPGLPAVTSLPFVPAPPSKPLPVPHPRRSKKPALVRQDGLEGSVHEGVAEGHSQGSEAGDGSGSSSPAALSLVSDAEQLASPSDSEPPGDSEPPAAPERDLKTAEEEEPDAPVPPPRQTSLVSHGHKASSLHRHASHSMDLLSCPEPRVPKRAGEEGRAAAADDEEDGYGDFERYPIAHSLPKQIKLGCQRPALGAGGRKALSAEGQDSPRAPPRKPQRHSLPAPPPPPAPPHAGAPTRDLPAPPALQEKGAWRFPRPSVTFFSRQAPGRSSVPPPQGRAPPPPAASSLGGKQRAQSFSAADLSSREPAANPRRSISFRKLMELRIAVKMLPKRLSRAGGGTPPDCSANGGETNGGREKGSSDAEANSSGEGSVEYENVPLYEEIPEYMNLPFHTGRLSLPHSRDSDIYEVQDPYLTALGDRYESGWMGRDDVHSEEDEVHSSDEDDNSSSSSKEHHEVVDRQQEDEMKRKKVVHIVQEIMTSEKVFVDVLKLLHIDFRDAVAKATRQNGKPVVEERVLSQILYYLPQLYELNRDLLRELEERVAHWADHQRLADIFLQKGPYLKMYSTYIRQFDNNVALLDEQCRKNPGFATVVREFEMSPRCASLALKHYLLKPVQRIPQYQLLLTDYLKNLPEDSEDYKDTQAALSIVKEVANHANDIMKQGDNFQKLMQIQYGLNGHHEVVQPGRVFLKEGTLMKLSRKEMQPRMFFLFNDALMYTTPVQSGQYKLNSVLSLAGMKVSKPSQEAYQNELNIESVERSFILSASSATEREQWLEAIARAIDDYTKKKITFISSRSQDEPDVVPDIGAPLGSKAPIWIPDLRATMCMICTCEFTLTWRRHHCRACGKVVCQACSTNKFYLEYLKNQPARVCDHCFTKLQENSKRWGGIPGKRKTLLKEVATAARRLQSLLSENLELFRFPGNRRKFRLHLKRLVSANTENSSMSGYLNRSKGSKKQWKRLWFVIKDKVLYTYAASEDVAALESQPLLGFFLREEKYGPAQRQQFKLYHKNTLFYIFKADDVPTAQRWIEAFQEAMILEE
ncbi:FYVE, RhoGEF and PH domain-containing protein 6 [Merluccius polli]|uniref:FYVE, RhoGEF and PH domain-containing protein 6 n=1 Tax=Merluccius polli TaxID=89951 RepID=A0AA47MMQ3_MERPO|nr:FYVE, RhoGEF and PH domain-containing protein 6 [Merluccius polli]